LISNDVAAHGRRVSSARRVRTECRGARLSRRPRAPTSDQRFHLSAFYAIVADDVARRLRLARLPEEKTAARACRPGIGEGVHRGRISARTKPPRISFADTVISSQAVARVSGPGPAPDTRF